MKNAKEYASVEERLIPATFHFGGDFTTPVTAFEILRSIGMLSHDIPRKISFSGEIFHSTQFF